jgi:hypothetical protein
MPETRAGADDAVVSHLAELVRDDFLLAHEGPLIGPSCWKRVFDTTATFFPRGEGPHPSVLASIATDAARN